MEQTIALSNVTIAQSGSAVSRTANWTHAGTSTYTLEKISLRFTMGTGNGYSVRVTEVIGSSYSDRLNTSGAATSGATLDLALNSASWEGKTSGTLTAVFSRRGNFTIQYTDISLVFTYREIADPSTATVQRTMAGQPQVVMISNTDPDVWHTVQWTYALDAQTQITSGELTYNAATRAPSWAVPAADMAALYAANPSSAVETGEVTVKTYLGQAYIGQNTYDAVLDFPETAETRPAISAQTISDVPDTVAQTIGNNYVQNHTTLKRTITATAYQGASIVQIRLVTPDGVATAAYGSNAEMRIRTSGTYTVQLQAVDSRGFVGTYDAADLSVLPYTDPAITSIQALRCDQQGSARDDGGYIWVEASATYTGDTVTYTAAITEKGGSTIIASGTLTGGTGVLGGSLDEDTTYEVTVTAADAYGVETSAVIEVGTSTITISRMAGGKGLAFGKKAERFGVEVNDGWPFRVHGAEILRLIMDIAHPVGSTIEALDASWDPNTAWPWTRWALTGGKWVRGV